MRNLGVLLLFLLSVAMVTMSVTAQARRANFITIKQAPAIEAPASIGEKSKPKKHHKDGGTEDEEDVAIPTQVF
jgi:hypothetical protein